MRLFFNLSRGLILGLCLIGLSGCDNKPAEPVADASADHDHDHGDHDHGDHDHIDAKDAGLSTDDLVSLDEPPLPDNYNEGVAKLVSLTKTISDGFANDKIDDAHGPLHEVSNLLEQINTLASESKMDADTKKSVTKTIDSLFDSFGAVDLKLHNAKKGKDYADVADDITASIKSLQSFVKE